MKKYKERMLILSEAAIKAVQKMTKEELEAFLLHALCEISGEKYDASPLEDLIFERSRQVWATSQQKTDAVSKRWEKRQPRPVIREHTGFYASTLTDEEIEKL